MVCYYLKDGTKVRGGDKMKETTEHECSFLPDGVKIVCVYGTTKGIMWCIDYDYYGIGFCPFCGKKLKGK